MKSVNKQIEDLLNNEHELYKYVFDLSQQDNADMYEQTFEKLLDDTRDTVREAGIYSLLFRVRSKKLKVRLAAVQFLQDKIIDFDLRIKSMSGLGVTYFGSREKELMIPILKIFKDESEQKAIRRTALESLLLLYGVDSREMTLRSGIYTNARDFENELTEIEKMLK